MQYYVDEVQLLNNFNRARYDRDVLTTFSQMLYLVSCAILKIAKFIS